MTCLRTRLFSLTEVFKHIRGIKWRQRKDHLYSGHLIAYLVIHVGRRDNIVQHDVVCNNTPLVFHTLMSNAGYSEGLVCDQTPATQVNNNVFLAQCDVYLSYCPRGPLSMLMSPSATKENKRRKTKIRKNFRKKNLIRNENVSMEKMLLAKIKENTTRTKL